MKALLPEPYFLTENKPEKIILLFTTQLQYVRSILSCNRTKNETETFSITYSLILSAISMFPFVK